METGICSRCKCHCGAEYDDGMQTLPSLAHGGQDRVMQVRQGEWLSNCCGASLVDEERESFWYEGDR